MIDHVRQVIARTLRVSLHVIGAWELVAKQDGQRVFGGSVPGMLRAELRVTLVGVDTELMNRLYSDQTGSWRMGSMDVNVRDQGLGVSSTPSLTLLHGKETQHIFKAAYQMFTVRRNQKRRRK